MRKATRSMATVAGLVLVSSVPLAGLASAEPSGYGTCRLGGTSTSGASGCAGSEGGFVATPTGAFICPLDRSFWVDPSDWGC